MKVTMADVNKRGNMIINRVMETGEVAVIEKHGKPIAEIRPIQASSDRDRAIRYLAELEPVAVGESPESVIESGRKRGL